MNIKKSGNSRNGHPYAENQGNNIIHVSLEDISVIRFEGVKVRIANIQGEPWFIVVDTCMALELINTTQAVAHLDPDEVMTLCLTKGHSGKRGGARKLLGAAESGFYKMVSRCRKASKPGTFPYRFTNWVFRDVIPSIRKTGAYGVPFAFLNDHSKRVKQYTITASKRGKALESCKKEKLALALEEAELWRKHQPDLLEAME